MLPLQVVPVFRIPTGLRSARFKVRYGNENIKSQKAFLIFLFSGFPKLAEANVQLECVMTRLTRKEMKAMSVDELWSLRDKVSEQLLARIAEEKRLLEERLRRLRSVRPQEKSARRPYPKVLPKFRNPDQPYQTWAGRGKQPRWLAAQLRTGKRIEDFLIAHQERRKRTR